MKKNKILSLLMAMVMVCTLLIGTQRNVQAADGQECVDAVSYTHLGAGDTIFFNLYLIDKFGNAANKKKNTVLDLSLIHI